MLQDPSRTPQHASKMLQDAPKTHLRRPDTHLRSLMTSPLHSMLQYKYRGSLPLSVYTSQVAFHGCMVCWSMNFTFRICSMHTLVKQNQKVGLRWRQTLHTSHFIAYSAERKRRASPPWHFMLCISPMLSLLKLQQKTTLHTSQFINACSAEKNNKERPFSWPRIEAREQRRRRVVNLNHSRTSTASSKTKHNMLMDSSQKTLSNQLYVPCLCRFPCSKASLKRTAITTRNKITCTAHKTNPVGTSMDDGDNHIESD